MRKFILVFLLGALFLFPRFASAQTKVRLASLTVQLWPEYDQPSMLVIHEFTLPEATQFPVDITFRFPARANLIAVAVTQNGVLTNTAFEGPAQDGEWQTITLSVENTLVYRFEYYEPLSLNGNTRLFTYLWNGNYAVDAFTLRVQEPADVVSLTGDPPLTRSQDDNGSAFYLDKIRKFDSGEQYSMKLSYNKTSDRLVVQSQSVQTNPIDGTTEGRPALANYLPYVFGGLAAILVAGGLVYFFQTSRDPKSPRRRRHSPNEEQGNGGVHCHQCGALAKAGDRFCRTCGTKLRLHEE